MAVDQIEIAQHVVQGDRVISAEQVYSDDGCYFLSTGEIPNDYTAAQAQALYDIRLAAIDVFERPFMEY